MQKKEKRNCEKITHLDKNLYSVCTHGIDI